MKTGGTGKTGTIDKTDGAWVKKQYATEKNLMKRMRIHAFSVNPVGWSDWLYGIYSIRPGMRILEIGCGNGLFWKNRARRLPDGVSLCLSDVSAGMLRKAKQNLSREGRKISFRKIDAERIPFPERAFDIVIANHMLYHVRDLPHALGEFRRVLKQGGFLYASTVGKAHLKELTGWRERFELKTELSGSAIAKNFGLGNGKKFLTRHFKSVTVKRHPDRLEIPSVRPVVDYLSSTGRLPDDTGLARFKIFLRDRLKKYGSIRISKNVGLFIARA